MPRYRCHKEVWALKIKAIEEEQHIRGAKRWLKTVIVPEEKGYGPFEVSPEFMQKHKPQPGGYYVVYKDGYASFSPAAAFEEGYALIA